MENVQDTMEQLKATGSRLVPGYMKPEGVVVEIDGNFYKKVFEPEEIAWKNTVKRERAVHDNIDVSHLLQPIRLEKLLARDERYIADYPNSLSIICADYVKDLDDESQIEGNEDEVKALKKNLGRVVFKFIRQSIEDKK